MRIFGGKYPALFVICVVAYLAFGGVAYGVTYTSTTAGGDWANPTTWSPNGIPITGTLDIVTVVSGFPVLVTDAQGCMILTLNR